MTGPQAAAAAGRVKGVGLEPVAVIVLTTEGHVAAAGSPLSPASGAAHSVVSLRHLRMKMIFV